MGETRDILAVAEEHGRFRALFEVVWFDPIKQKGRAVVREPGLHGSIFFRVKEMPEDVIGPSTEAFRRFRKAKGNRELRNELRWQVKDLICGVRFRADIDFDSKDWLVFVPGTIVREPELP